MRLPDWLGGKAPDGEVSLHPEPRQLERGPEPTKLHRKVLDRLRQNWDLEQSPTALLGMLEGVYARRQRLTATACLRRLVDEDTDELITEALDFSEAWADGHFDAQQHAGLIDRLGGAVRMDVLTAIDDHDLRYTKERLRISDAVLTLLQEELNCLPDALECVGELVHRFNLTNCPPFPNPSRGGGIISKYESDWRRNFERDTQCRIIREVFHSPFRLVEFHPHCCQSFKSVLLPLAQSIYLKQAFDELPILADALEEAGCTDDDILTHCHETEGHVRGCWVLELVMGNTD